MGTTDEYRCTLTEQQAAGRIDADRALADRVRATTRLQEGLQVTFDSGQDTRRLVDTFVANEQQCCSFFDFAVEETGEAVVLEITAPEADSAQQLVDAARQAFELGPDAFMATTGWEPTGA